MSCLRRKAVGWLGRKGNFWFRAILWPFHQSCTCALAFLHGPGTGTFLRPGLMLQHHYINLDCTCPRTGSRRNRYVSAAPAWNRTPGLAVQKSKPRLSVAANKSCLRGRTSKIWSCAPAPYGKGTHVCAASTGRVLQPVPGAVSALNSSLSEVASLCSTGTAPFFKAIPPHTNPQNGACIDEQGKTP